MSALPSWRDAKRVALDYETCDEQINDLGPGTRRGAYIVGAAFAIEDGPSYYLPMRHEGGGNLDVDQVINYLKDQAKDFTGSILASGAQYEIDMGEHAGINFKPKQWVDPTIYEPLLDELQLKYGLDHVLLRRGFAGKDETVLRAAANAHGIHPKKHLHKLHSKYVGAYGERDVAGLFELCSQQEREITEQDLWETVNLELDLIPVLAEMRKRGVRIDLDEVDRLEQQAWAVIDEEMARFSYETGAQLSRHHINKATALGAALRGIGLSVPMTDPSLKNPETKSKPKPQIDDQFFTNYADSHDGKRKAFIRHVPAVAALQRARKWKKLEETARGRKEAAICHGDEWRIHPTFNQLRAQKDDADPEGARFGRMSAADPNVQQEPVRYYEFAEAWRGVYKPDRGGEWASADFSQQEPRNWVHYSLIAKLPGAEEFARRWREDPKLSFHKMTAEITGLDVADAKNCGLGIGYGMGGGALCETWLNLPTVMKYSEFLGRTYKAAGPEGQRVIDIYYRGVPFLKPLGKLLQAKVEAKGYLVLFDAGKRRLRFPPKASGGYEWAHKALNRVSQGRAAIQTKVACLAMHRAGVPLQIAVHDEFNWTTYSREDAKQAAIVMRDADQLRVRNRVVLEVGPDWGHLNDEIDLEAA